MDSTPDIIDFSELKSTMNLDPRFIAGNILNHTTTQLQNSKQ